MNKIIWILGGLILVAAVSVSSIFLYSQYFLVNQNSTKETTKETENVTETLDTNKSQLFSGTVEKLTLDLDLLPLTENDIANGVQGPVYYKAGVYNYGKYKGFTRIIIVQQPMGPGGARSFVLATKDFKTYVLDGDKQLSEMFPLESYNNPLSGFNLSKVTEIAQLETEHPQVINLDNNFGLIKTAIGTTYINNSQENHYMYVLLTGVTSYNPVNIKEPNLSFYTKPTLNQDEDISNFIQTDTGFYVKDETGLIYEYQMSLKPFIETYLVDYKDYLVKLSAFEKKQTANPEDTSLTYPDYVTFPGFSFKGSDLNTSVNTYKNYSSAIPNACGSGAATKVLKNISESDLTKIGNYKNIDIYAFRNLDHAILKAEYKSKIDYDDEFFKDVNMVSKPSYEEYVKKYPVLVFKDSLGRFLAIGEYDYLLPGGCGKPVIYLYPEEPTEVTVKLNTPVSFSKAIPDYDGGKGWQVVANPDGSLSSLNKTTDCSKMDTSFGSEYAKKACTQNNYPYIYWSGTVTNKQYPTTDRGWIVAKNDLSGFIQEKLSYIGLSENEITDFTSYWVAVMQKKNTPYYKVSFLQNDILNNFIPMSVTPMPKSTIRVFMDWKALDEKISIEPQELKQMTRKGFTLVEWGGLKF